MFEDVHNFLEKHFFPEAPISRWLGLRQSQSYWVWAWVECLLMEQQSLAAVDGEGNIRGVIIGKETIRLDLSLLERLVDFWYGGGWEDWLGWLIWRAAWWLRWLLPSYYGEWTAGLFGRIQAELGWEEQAVLESQDCQQLYTVCILCVEGDSRGRGLGARLVSRAQQVASARGCDCAAVIVSSLYSERIFSKLHYTSLKQIRYSELVDGKGRRLVGETGEHKNIALLFRKLRTKQKTAF